jgi:hypothetical protein
MGTAAAATSVTAAAATSVTAAAATSVTAAAATSVTADALSEADFANVAVSDEDFAVVVAAATAA